MCKGPGKAPKVKEADSEGEELDVDSDVEGEVFLPEDGDGNEHPLVADPHGDAGDFTYTVEEQIQREWEARRRRAEQRRALLAELLRAEDHSSSHDSDAMAWDHTSFRVVGDSDDDSIPATPESGSVDEVMESEEEDAGVDAGLDPAFAVNPSQIQTAVHMLQAQPTRHQNRRQQNRHQPYRRDR